MDDQTLISSLSLHLSRFQCRSGQQSVLSYVIKNVIVFNVIFSGKNENGDNWYSVIIGTFPVQYIFTTKKKTLKEKLPQQLYIKHVVVFPLTLYEIDSSIFLSIKVTFNVPNVISDIISKYSRFYSSCSKILACNSHLSKFLGNCCIAIKPIVKVSFN